MLYNLEGLSFDLILVSLKLYFVRSIIFDMGASGYRTILLA